MTDLDTWTNYVTIINAERLNAIRNTIIVNEGNVSSNKVGIDLNTSGINRLEDEKLDRDGSQWMQGNLNLSSNFITFLPNPTLGYHAANKSYVDTDIDNLSALQGDYLLLNGSRTMTGNLNLGTYDIFGDAPVLGSGNDTGYVQLKGGASHAARFNIYGKDHVNYPGRINCWVTNVSKTTITLCAYAQGVTDTPKWALEHGLLTDLIEEKTDDAGVTVDGCLIKDGGATMTGALNVSNDVQIAGDLNVSGFAFTYYLKALELYSHSDTQHLFLQAGTTWGQNPIIWMYPKDHGTYAGDIHFYVSNTAKNSIKCPLILQHDDEPYAWTPYGVGTSLIGEYYNNSGVTIDGVRCRDGKTSDVKSIAFHLNHNDDNQSNWLLGTGTVDTLYQFNQAVILKDYRYTFLSGATNGRFDVHLNDSGTWANESSHTGLNAGGHRATVSLGDKAITTSNGLAMKVLNGSNISHLTVILNYE